MALDKDLKKEDASYSWSCPYCDKVGYTQWNKSCYYQLTEHCQEEHLEETFKVLIAQLMKISEQGKKNMIRHNWGIFNNYIQDIKNAPDTN